MFTVEEQTIINLYRQASSSMTRSELLAELTGCLLYTSRASENTSSSLILEEHRPLSEGTIHEDLETSIRKSIHKSAVLSGDAVSYTHLDVYKRQGMD